MFMNQNKFSSNGDHQEKMTLHQFSTLISTCSSDQALMNWDQSLTMSQNFISESINSTVSSHAVSNNALVSTDEIVVKDQLPSPQYSQMLMEMSSRSNSSFNSTYTYSYTTQFNHLEIPDSKNSIRSYSNSETVENDAAFDEKAAEFFNSQFNPSIIRNGSMCSRGSTKPAFEKALVPSLELKLRKLILNSSAHETTEFANSKEENSGSKRITDTNASLNGSNSRKRKEISRGKAKDLPPPPPPVKNGIGNEKNGVKLSENRNFRRQPDGTSRPSPEAPNEYIHVRARRGQAIDNHSLAERVRREKINKRMKLLQDLVPGCHKITGKAVMLDEIINYVQSLQRQVQFLSMKLATVNPSLDFNVEALPSDNMLRSIHPLDSSMLIIGECEEAAASRAHMVGDDMMNSKALCKRDSGKCRFKK